MSIMSLTPDRQGYLGDPMMKTLPELIELLERHEKLLNRKFLNTLPDKGEKTRKFVESLKQIIDLKSSQLALSSPPQIYSVKKTPVSLSDTHSPDSTGGYDEDHQSESFNEDTVLLEFVARRDEQNMKIQQGHSEDRKNAESTSNKEDALIASLKQMDLGTKLLHKEDTSHFVNSYERVIRKAEERPANKNKFMPNRSLRDTHIPPAPYEHIQVIQDNSKYEESAAKPPEYKYKESKLISVEESVKLIQEQRSKIEELTAERAARRLADQLGPKMEKYSPQEIDMHYRSKDVEIRDSDDDDNDNQDDEDADSDECT